jgi:hypothetical protein
MRGTIFQDRTPMPSADADKQAGDAPIRTTQTPSDAKAGAQSLSKEGSDHMNVVNCCRPRRGHDY